jgi:hypothetical protein
MIAVNIRKSGDTAATLAQVMKAASGDWVVSEGAVEEHGDVLLAVRRNTVLGAFEILSWDVVDGGRVRFELDISAEYAGLVGQPSPALWKRGQSNPVALLNTDDVDAAPASAQAAKKQPRRGVHRLTIEWKGLSDKQAAELHLALLTMAGTSGRMSNFRTTSLVGEMKRAKEHLEFTYVSAKSPKAIRD